jgi:uncharacterized protein (TIGR02271 family)
MPDPINFSPLVIAVEKIDGLLNTFWARVGRCLFRGEHEGASTEGNRSAIEAAGDVRTVSRDQLELLSEMLHVTKERIERGEVRVRKELVTENQIIEVPVTREELVIERYATSGDRSRLDVARDQKEVRIPLWEEVVRVEKRPVISEVVNVSKLQVNETRTISDSVRHEELRVEPSGDVEIRDRGDADEREAA